MWTVVAVEPIAGKFAVEMAVEMAVAQMAADTWGVEEARPESASGLPALSSGDGKK